MQNHVEPLVSIIVCTYNRSAHLSRTLHSLLQLDYLNREIIVVDNNSSDDTAVVVSQFPVNYILEENPGVAFARNAGLAAATGEFVGFIDDDETVAPGWIQGILNGFALDENVAAVTGPVYPCYAAPPPNWLEDTVHTVPNDEKYKQYRLLSTSENLGTGNSMFRRRALETIRFNTALGRKRGSLLAGEDTDFVCQLYAKGYIAAYSPEAAVYHSIPAERVALRYFMRRFFYEGLTEYFRKGPRVVWRRLLKPVADIIALLVAMAALQPRRVTARWLRLCQTAGILFGPLYELIYLRKKQV